MKLNNWLIILLSIGYLENSFATNEFNLDVLESSVAACFPKIMEASTKVELSEAKVRKNDSPFDTRLSANTFNRHGTSYDSSYSRLSLEKRLFGPVTVYGGYDISGGNTPSYEGSTITSYNGRNFIGLKLNLLNGFSMDEERFSVYNAILDKDKAKRELELTNLLVRTDAMKSYLNWIAAGLELRAFENLLELAEARQSAMKKKYKRGDLAEIAVKENYNNILKRKVRLMSARNSFKEASLDLSLYYRDGKCNIIIPKKEFLPKEMPRLASLEEHEVESALAEAIKNRPEFQVIDVQREKIVNQLKLSNNYLLPNLDLSLEYRKNNAELPTVTNFLINQNENLVRLEFSMPLGRSYGKGLNSEASAALRKLHYERQLLSDKLKTKLETLHFVINNTVDKVLTSESEVELSKELLAAEKTRFDNGDSNFFLLNMREENVANSYLSLIGNTLEYHQALIQYQLLIARSINLNTIYYRPTFSYAKESYMVN